MKMTCRTDHAASHSQSGRRDSNPRHPAWERMYTVGLFNLFFPKNTVILAGAPAFASIRIQWRFLSAIRGSAKNKTVVYRIINMPFPLSIRLEALIACQRHCSLCHVRKHTRMQCHHIIQEADSGPNSFDNCIPLCPDCHAEVLAFNPKHPFGATPYHPEELKRRRDDWYAAVNRRSCDLADQIHRTPLNYPHNPSIRGTISFNYANHEGFYRLGEGNFEFLTHWIKSSDRDVQCYRDGTNISLALVPKDAQLQGIKEASLLNFSSRDRRPQLGQFVVFENHVCAVRGSKNPQNSRRHSPRAQKTFWFLITGYLRMEAKIFRRFREFDFRQSSNVLFIHLHCHGRLLH